MCLEILDVGDLEALAFFKGLDKLRGFQHGVEGAGVQPGGAPGQNLDLESTAFEVRLIDGGDLQFTTG